MSLAEARRVLSEKMAIYGEAEPLLIQATAMKAEAIALSESATREAGDLRRSADDYARTVRLDTENAHNAAVQKLAEATREESERLDWLRFEAESLHNRIEGYGDRYLEPVSKLLDWLETQTEYTESGRFLKEARAASRAMVRAGTAVQCIHPDKATAKASSRFILDAFNGKVDSVLAEVAIENHGTLEREIEDAYILVNREAVRFGNAHITREYCQARIVEMKAACAAHEVKRLEREEQRAERERMREEEKAQRELDRAEREARAEEERARRAVEQARREMDRLAAERAREEAQSRADYERALREAQAEQVAEITRLHEEAQRLNSAQRAEQEARLAELAVKLSEAEEKGRRALSMAQQTRAGHVYVISNIGSFGEEVFKVGMTRRVDPQERIDELGDASVPFDFDVHAIIRSDDAPALESALHKKLNDLRVNKVNQRKEFFRTDAATLRRMLEEEGVQASFTLAAEAREYRESKAFSKEHDVSAIPV